MSRRGFTLIEVVVALLLSGTVLLTGAAAFGAAADALGAAGLASRAALATANRRAWLERALHSLEVGLPGGTPFEGEPGQVRFSARLQTSKGWWERRSVTLGLDGDAFTADLDGNERIVLASQVASVHFDYLILPGLETRWTHRWQSPVSAPLAIRVRLTWRDPETGADTLLVFIGERG